MTAFLKPKIDQIPIEIQESFRWGVWIASPRPNQPGKFNKAPRSAITGRPISINRPEAFVDFETCWRAFEAGTYTGIGILLDGSDWIGVDIDNFANIPAVKRQSVTSWLAQAFLQGAYVERSPSGSGLRAIFRGRFQGKGRKVGSLEIYQEGRFMTVTGHALAAVGELTENDS